MKQNKTKKTQAGRSAASWGRQNMLPSLFAGAELSPHLHLLLVLLLLLLPPLLLQEAFLLSEGGGTLESIRQWLRSVGSVQGQRHGLLPSPPPPPRPAMDDANSCRNHKTLSDYKHNETVTYYQQLNSGTGASRVTLAAVFIPL